MTDAAKKVLDYLLPRLIIVLCLPADYLGILWLAMVGAGAIPRPTSHTATTLHAQLDNHPILAGLVVFGVYDSVVVQNFGLAALIVATVLWLFHLIVGTGRLRKVQGFVSLLLAVLGIYFAKLFFAR